MNSLHHVISVSGGKDSTALLLLAIEQHPENLSAVFADTGNEHQITYDYLIINSGWIVNEDSKLF